MTTRHVQFLRTCPRPGSCREGQEENSWSPWGRGDPTANRHGNGPLDLQDSTGVPRGGTVWADRRSRQAREAQPFGNPISQGHEALLGQRGQPSPVLPAQDPPPLDLGFPPPPSSPEPLLRPGSALRSGCGRTCSEHTGDRLNRHHPPEPGLGAHLAGNAMPWQVSSRPKTRCANSNTCAPSSTNPLRGLLLPSTHREEPQHPRTPGAHAGTVSPIQQHPGEPKRGPPTPSLAGGCRHGRGCSPSSITL